MNLKAISQRRSIEQPSKVLEYFGFSNTVFEKLKGKVKIHQLIPETPLLILMGDIHTDALTQRDILRNLLSLQHPQAKVIAEGYPFSSEKTADIGHTFLPNLFTQLGLISLEEQLKFLRDWDPSLSVSELYAHIQGSIQGAEENPYVLEYGTMEHRNKEYKKLLLKIANPNSPIIFITGLYHLNLADLLKGNKISIVSIKPLRSIKIINTSEGEKIINKKTEVYRETQRFLEQIKTAIPNDKKQLETLTETLLKTLSKYMDDKSTPNFFIAYFAFNTFSALNNRRQELNLNPISFDNQKLIHRKFVSHK